MKRDWAGWFGAYALWKRLRWCIYKVDRCTLYSNLYHANSIGLVKAGLVGFVVILFDEKIMGVFCKFSCMLSFRMIGNWYTVSLFVFVRRAKIGDAARIRASCVAATGVALGTA